MTEQSPEALVRKAWDTYGRGDIEGLLEYVDPNLTWTFLDPSEADPEPRTCHGRDELRQALRRQAAQGLTTRIDQVTGHGDRVLLVLHTAGLDQHRARAAGDRNYMVVTVRGGRVTDLYACRDEAEGHVVAGLT